MYPDNFYSSTFTLLAEAEVGKHFYWNIAISGFVLFQVSLFVVTYLSDFSVIASHNSKPVRPHKGSNFTR